MNWGRTLVNWVTLLWTFGNSTGLLEFSLGYWRRTGLLEFVLGYYGELSYSSPLV